MKKIYIIIIFLDKLKDIYSTYVYKQLHKGIYLHVRSHTHIQTSLSIMENYCQNLNVFSLYSLSIKVVIYLYIQNIKIHGETKPSICSLNYTTCTCIHRENYKRYQKYLSYIQKGRYTSIFEKCIYCIYIFSMQNFQTCMYIFISGFQMWIKCHKGEDYFPFRHTRTDDGICK